jgi:hypothetical protein
MDPNLFPPAPRQSLRFPVALGALFAGGASGVGCAFGQISTMPGGTRPYQESVLMAGVWLGVLAMISVFVVWAMGGLRPPERAWARALFLVPVLGTLPVMGFFMVLAGMAKGPA